MSPEVTSWCSRGTVRDDIGSPLPVLENEGDSERLVEVASLLAVGRVHDEIIEALRLDRLTALSKPDGGVRGIVVGDILRRMVARTIAKQIAKQVEAATAPFQHALSTKAGCECVAHMLQSMTDLNPEVTVTAIDGVVAYDLISRSSMLEGLLRMEGGDQILLFVRMSYSNPSTCLWEDELGVSQHFSQGEEGSREIPSCPCSSHWASIRPSFKPKQGCLVMRSVPSWMTSTSQASRAGPQKRTPLWKRNSGPTQASTSTMAKPKCGIVVVCGAREHCATDQNGTSQLWKGTRSCHATNKA